MADGRFNLVLAIGHHYGSFYPNIGDSHSAFEARRFLGPANYDLMSIEEDGTFWSLARMHFPLSPYPLPFTLYH